MNLINFINPSDLSKSDKVKFSEKNWVLVPSLTPSDSSTMSSFEVPKVKLGAKDLIQTGKSYKIRRADSVNGETGVFKRVQNVVFSEIKRQEQAINEIFDIVDNFLIVKKDLDISKYLKKTHYDKLIYNEDGSINLQKTFLNDKGFPTGKTFYFQDMFIVEKDKDGKEILTSLDNTNLKNGFPYLKVGEIDSKKMTIINDFVEKFINQQIAFGIEDFKDNKQDLKGKHPNISNGTFENLVAEYVLNTFIFNVTQFNWFNGTLSEFKSGVESNKRAKQMYAPGVRMSPDFMVMQYENGNWSDGVHFNAITIEDFVLSSKDLKTIEERIRQGLLLESPNLIDNLIELEKQVKIISKPYTDIEATDGFGYSTIDRVQQIFMGRGLYDSNNKKFLQEAREGTLKNGVTSINNQSRKGYYYNRGFDPTLNLLTSNQIKYSSMMLSPQLVKGTELEKLMNWMNKNNVEEVIFATAHKVGAKMIYKIHNEDGSINEDALNKAVPTKYLNSSYSIQLDTPEHLIDTENLLATQVSKLALSNIKDTTEYNVNGKTYTGKALKEHYFDVLNQNIKESAADLLKDLGIIREDGVLKVTDKQVQAILKEEIASRGLSENYEFSIELEKDGTFKIPLFINSMSDKWEAILTSLFTNRIIKQKLQGGSAVLGSRVFLDNVKTINEVAVETGIQWSKEKTTDHTLKSYVEDSEQGNIQVVEVLLSAWNSNLFKDGERIHIDEISADVKTMIGYRIPFTSKAYMTVFKVVGFLPESHRGTIIAPDDMIPQMGQDFDIDKWFIMNKHFSIDENGKEIVPTISKDDNSKKARQNELFNIIKAVITNKEHFKEMSTPSGYAGLKNLKNRIAKEIKDEDASLIPTSERGQRLFRKRNIAGKDLTAIAANLNAFGAIAQHTKMQLANPFIFKIDTSKINNKELETLLERYQENIQIDGKGIATINFKNLGYSPDGSYLNALNKLILDVASEGVAAAVDGAKDPVLDALNFTTYTYSTYHVGVLAGVPQDTMALFVRQPIIKLLNQYYFDNNSVLSKSKQDHTSRLRRYFQTKLYEALLDSKRSKPVQELQKVLDRRIKDSVQDSFDKTYLIYLDKDKTQDILEYNPEEAFAFTEEELFNNLKIAVKGKSKLSKEEWIDFLTSQLKVLETFIKYKKTSEVVERLVRTTKTDSIGAGPSMQTTNNLIRSINSLENNENVTINDKPAIQAIYPKHFKLKDEVSAYSPLETYLEEGNKLSIEVLSNFFISQSLSFKDVLYTIGGMQPKEGTSEEMFNFVNKFLNVSILQNFNDFKGIDKAHVLGVDKVKTVEDKTSVEFNTDLNLSIDDFKMLSVGEKVYYLKNKLSDVLIEDNLNILNFLNVDIEKIGEKGFHKIDFQLYKNSFTDDSITDSIMGFIDSGDPYLIDFAASLLEYNVVSHGLSFGLESFSKVLPNEVLHEIGLGTYLKNIKKELDVKNYFSTDIIDKFYKNNFNNTLVVPTVKADYQYLSEGLIKKGEDLLLEGKSLVEISDILNVGVDSLQFLKTGKTDIIKTDIEGNRLTKDKTPTWDYNQNILSYPEKSVRDVSDKVYNAPYITIYSKDGPQLYKKYTKEVFDSTMIEPKLVKVFNGNIYYYKVNKLGKNGIFEFTSKSIFSENNTKTKEQDLIFNIENAIQNVVNSKVADNVTKQEQEEQNKSCTIQGKR